MLTHPVCKPIRRAHEYIPFSNSVHEVNQHFRVLYEKARDFKMQIFEDTYIAEKDFSAEACDRI